MVQKQSTTYLQSDKDSRNELINGCKASKTGQYLQSNNQWYSTKHNLYFYGQETISIAISFLAELRS